MKRLFSTLTLLLALTVTAFAQTPVTKTSPDRASEPVVENYEKTSDQMEQYLNARLDLDVQTRITKALDINEQQITKFQPLYTAYQEEKDEIDMRRKQLITRYTEEMKEDDTAKDEENETADFVENYWELDIDAMKLKKNYFDRLEDIVGTAKALDFFSMDEMYTARLNRMRMQAVPDLMVVATPRVSYENEINDYHNWSRINIDGKVDVSHDFTNNGLTKLWNVVGQISRAEGIEVNDLPAKKQKVMMLADNMQKNWKDLSHADYARQAFVMTAETLMEITNDKRFATNMTAVKRLKRTAEMIDPQQKLTDQAQTIYAFFNDAEMIVNKIVDQANGMSK